MSGTDCKENEGTSKGKVAPYSKKILLLINQVIGKIPKEKIKTLSFLLVNNLQLSLLHTCTLSYMEFY